MMDQTACPSDARRGDDPRSTDRAVERERRRLQDFIDSSISTFWEIDRDLRFTFYSDRDSGDGGAGASAFVLGRSLPELLGDKAKDEPWASHLADLEAHRPFREFHYTIEAPEGARHLSSSGRPFFDEDGAFRGYRGITHDVTELEEARRASAWHAERDALTGLFNRRRWTAALEDMFAQGCETGALLLLDLDRFKAVNDTHGHAVGDGLLCHVAEVLRASVRQTDIPARLGGDEFAVLLRGRVTRAQAAAIARRILDGLKPAIEIEGRDVRASTSIGIALRATYQGPAEGFVSVTDRALYAAKNAGRGTYVFHDTSESIAA